MSQFTQEVKVFRQRYKTRAVEVAARLRNLAKSAVERRHWDRVILALEGVRKNPIARADYAKVARLYESFTGHHAEPLAKVEAPTIPSVASDIDTLDFVGYT